MEKLPCPDGFLIDSDDALRPAHEQINLWLLEAEEWQESHPHDSHRLDPKLLKKQYRVEQVADFLAAAVVRAQWHAGRREGMQVSGHAARVANIVLALSRVPLKLTEAQLEPLLKYAISQGDYWWPREETIAQVEELFHNQDLSAGTWRLLHQVHAAMAADNSISGQTVRRKFAVLLWHDPYDAVDLKNCWSETIRQDLRAMKDEKRRSWSAALRNNPVSDTTEPPKPWTKTADKCVASIGSEPFRDQLLVWFKPFAEPQPVRLTMAGSHILKVLLWYCRLLRDAAPDQRLDPAVCSLLDTKWRNKEFVFRPLTVLAGNLALFPPDVAWPLVVRIREQLGKKAAARLDAMVKQIGEARGLDERALKKQKLIEQDPEPFPLGSFVQKMFRQATNLMTSAGPTAPNFQHDGDYIEIKGQRDLYRAHTPSCTIRRVRDNALVSVDYDRVPDNLKALLRAEDDRFQRFTKLMFALTMDGNQDFLVFHQEP